MSRLEASSSVVFQTSHEGDIYNLMSIFCELLRKTWFTYCQKHTLMFETFNNYTADFLLELYNQKK